MKLMLTILVLLLLPFYIIAQPPSQADIDKMMKQAQDQMSKYSKDTNAIKMLNDVQRNSKQVSNAVQNNTSTSFANSAYEHLKLPPKKLQLLNLIPKKILSQSEVKSMAATLHKQLKKYCGPAAVSNSEKIIRTGPAANLSQLAVLLWYKYAMEEAALVSVYAASQSPDDLTLNNCSAILNSSGLSTYSVSFLKHALQHCPDNSTLLNNLGQAYFSLGETDSATRYLLQCIKRSPQHPEANKTEAVIEAGKGDKEKAKKMIEEAMKGSFSEEGKRIVKFLDPATHYSKFIKPRIKVPEYFNSYKFRLPQICRNRGDVPRALSEIKAYKEEIEVLIKKHGAITAENFKIQADKMMNLYEQQQAGKTFNPGLPKNKPFFNTAASVLTDIAREFNARIDIVDKKYIQLDKDASRLVKEHEIEFQKLMKHFHDRQIEYGKTHEGASPEISEEQCNAENKLFDKYQAAYVEIAEPVQLQYFRVWADHINDISFWLYLGSLTKTEFHQRFSHYAATYLARLNGLAHNSLPMFSYCGKPVIAKSDRSMNVGEPECPVNLEIPLGVGKINIDCDVFEVELGEGLVFNYERNFKTGTSTIAFGAGLSAGIPEMEFLTSAGDKIPYAPLELGAKQQFYISFDRDLSISDIGVLWEAEADIKGMNNPEAKATMKLGMMSGTLEIDEGPLKPVADKIFGLQPEKQLNKNVPVYKPKEG